MRTFNGATCTFSLAVLTAALGSLAWAGTDGPKTASRSNDVPRQGTLSGKLVDPDGKPVVGAKLWIDSWSDDLKKENRIAETRSDKAGRFRFGPMAPIYRNWYPILIDANGFARQYVRGQSYSVFAGADSDLGKIRLERGRVFTGHVIDADGKPYPNAEVHCSLQLYYMGHTFQFFGPDFVVQTDSSGRYRTPPLPVCWLELYTQPPERQMAWIGHPIAPGGSEELRPLQLKHDVPINGMLKDENGNPVVDARINANAEFQTKSDAAGKFTIHGFGDKARFQLQIQKAGYVFFNAGVKRDEQTKLGGDIRYRLVDDSANNWHGPFKELAIKMQSLAWIEGHAVDAETGQPVRLTRIVRCGFDRKPNGETVLSGCTATPFEQPEPGHFRVSYQMADEYHLALSADGYHDAEAYTPKVATLRPISGIVVKMTKKREGTKAQVAQQTISGVVTRGGKPVRTGWVGLWLIRDADNAANGSVLRERTVCEAPRIFRSALIRDGKYSVEVPFQDEQWLIVAEEPGQALTQVGPIKIALNQKKHLDIACTHAGSIRGRVENVPAGWEGDLWAVAFTSTGIQAETRVERNGEFAFSQLPPGKYGLKVGHDGYHDPEVDSYDKPPDPWRRAKIVTVDQGEAIDGVTLDLPPQQRAPDEN